jgi:preprotein translocase subunit YajC
MFANLILLAQASGDSQGGGGLGALTTFLPVMLILFAFYVLLVLPRKRAEKKEREDLLSKLKKNDEVLTYSGIIGIVAQVKETDEVVLKVDESSNVRLRVLKSSIARILSPKETGKEATPATGAATGDNVKAGTPPAK